MSELAWFAENEADKHHFNSVAHYLQLNPDYFIMSGQMRPMYIFKFRRYMAVQVFMVFMYVLSSLTLRRPLTHNISYVLNNNQRFQCTMCSPAGALNSDQWINTLRGRGFGRVGRGSAQCAGNATYCRSRPRPVTHISWPPHLVLQHWNTCWLQPLGSLTQHLNNFSVCSLLKSLP